MEAFFEDAASIDYSLTQKYPFYTFIDGAGRTSYPLKAHWHYYVEILYVTSGMVMSSLMVILMIFKLGTSYL